MKRRKFLQGAALSAGCLFSPQLIGKSKMRAAKSPNIAAEYPHIIEQIAAYAGHAHTENIPGQWVDKSKGFKGHREK